MRVWRSRHDYSLFMVFDFLFLFFSCVWKISVSPFGFLVPVAKNEGFFKMPATLTKKKSKTAREDEGKQFCQFSLPLFFLLPSLLFSQFNTFFYMLRGKKERQIVKSSSLNKQFSQWNWKKSTTTFCLMFFTFSPIGFFVPTLGKLSSHDDDEELKWRNEKQQFYRIINNELGKFIIISWVFLSFVRAQ